MINLKYLKSSQLSVIKNNINNSVKYIYILKLIGTVIQKNIFYYNNTNIPFIYNCITIINIIIFI